ncbi:transposase, IS111A/IS1328/IS1533 domain protein [Desulfosporosinus sp. OT]|nr:transposase, IS111A/IS1328/IS1533 domain protein [Desulfosporosinus sp. OT]
MESTGAYHYPVLTYLKEHDISASVINPLVMNKYVNVAIRKGKTDKLDAIKIANFGLDQNPMRTTPGHFPLIISK